ncbi:MAG: NAD-dependent protein deacylase [Spirochaetota bacterium]|jgi:NAD-dependent deacetylase|nr:NAD-dependent protein deacylase [Spirochaetota bacterium]
MEQLKSMLQAASAIVFFGGAGVSTESGIPDFRSADGLYNERYAYPPEVMLSHSFFVAHTEEFFRFYREKMIYSGAQPNPAHRALAELEAMGKLKAVITQNIDGLHTLAGSKRVLELHGSVYRNYCVRCHAAYPLETVVQAEAVPVCACGGVIKPDVVLYEEGLDPEVLQDSARAIEEADALIIGGTSLNVYPAAGLVRYYSGDKLILINKSATPYDARANLVIRESIGEVLHAAVAALH